MAPAELSRLRRKKVIRNWVSQTNLLPRDLIMPYFVVEGGDVKDPVKSMPGVYRLSIDNLLRHITGAHAEGIRSVLLFGIPHSRDETGSAAHEENGVVQKAVRAIRKEFPGCDEGGLIVITDVCLCGYTTHGHCGIIRRQKTKNGRRREEKNPSSLSIDPDATLPVLAGIALSHAAAGADFVAPSAMMDGQAKAIRETLDANGYNDAGILAYSAKFASNFYGPFREALGSAPRFGDRKSYQLDYRNADEALREIQADIDEGADIVMVKPALAYLDIIYRAHETFRAPIAAYSVSGEYSLIKNLSREDDVKEKALVLEVLTSIKRAGADLIITYHAQEAARWLRQE